MRDGYDWTSARRQGGEHFKPSRCQDFLRQLQQTIGRRRGEGPGALAAAGDDAAWRARQSVKVDGHDAVCDRMRNRGTFGGSIADSGGIGTGEGEGVIYFRKVGAGTFNPHTFLRAIGPEPWNVAYVEPSRRPTDGRYGENPNRLQQFHQYQVILKPSPLDIQDLYLESLRSLGTDPSRHDIRSAPFMAAITLRA